MTGAFTDAELAHLSPTTRRSLVALFDIRQTHLSEFTDSNRPLVPTAPVAHRPAAEPNRPTATPKPKPNPCPTHNSPTPVSTPTEN